MNITARRARVDPDPDGGCFMTITFDSATEEPRHVDTADDVAQALREFDLTPDDVVYDGEAWHRLH